MERAASNIRNSGMKIPCKFMLQSPFNKVRIIIFVDNYE